MKAGASLTVKNIGKPRAKRRYGKELKKPVKK
jgi:hypothetical protein